MLSRCFVYLLRLYLVTIVTYSAAIYLIPKLVIQLFEHSYLDYNVEQSRGLQTLIVAANTCGRRWSGGPRSPSNWAATLRRSKCNCCCVRTPADTPKRPTLLEQGKPVIRLGDWGWMEEISSPLNAAVRGQADHPAGPAGHQPAVLDHQRADRRGHARVPAGVAAPALA